MSIPMVKASHLHHQQTLRDLQPDNGTLAGSSWGTIVVKPLALCLLPVEDRSLEPISAMSKICTSLTSALPLSQPSSVVHSMSTLLSSCKITATAVP